MCRSWLVLFAFAILWQAACGMKYNNDVIFENRHLLGLENGLAQEAQYNVTLREWPWLSWAWGPNCPVRHHQRLVGPLGEDPAVKVGLANLKLYLDAVIRDLNAVNLQMGVMVGIVYGDEILLAEGFGRENLSTSQPPNINSIYNIGSVTKIFTSLGLYRTISQGKVSLDSKVTEYFNEERPPVFGVRNPYSSEGPHAITFHSLATHSSGLPREAYCGIYPLSKECADQDKAAQVNLDALSQIGLLFSPMTGSHYSNLGSALLGRALERVWGEKYEDYLVDEILRPLAMNSTGFEYTKEVKERMVEGYVAAGPNLRGNYSMNRTPFTHSPMGWSAPAGGLYSSTADLLRFFQFVFAEEGNEVINKTALNSYLSPGVLLPDGISLFGSGTFETFYANNYWTLTKGGLTASMAASISLIPALKLGVSVLVNINSGYIADQINARANLYLAPSIALALSQHQTKLPLPPNYQQLLGSYAYQPRSVFLQINDTSDGSKNGVLSGFVYGLGDVYFVWDSAQDYNGSIAFRYSSTQESFISCVSLASIGNNAIAYFTPKNNSYVVTIADSNSSLYFIPKLN